MGTRLRSLALLAGLTAATATSVVPQSSPSARSGTMEVSAVIRTASLQVLPVALSRFGLVASSGDTLVLATGRDGTGAMAVPAGAYTLVSLEPIEIDGSRYRWSVPATVRADTLTHLDLSNLNAIVEQSTELSHRTSGTSVSEAELFRRYGPSVVRVEAGLGHGSGFVADTLGGVILTNAHVVGHAGEGEIIIQLDSLTRVEGQVLARDNNADVAVLRVPPRFLEGRPPMRLAAGDVAIVPGDRLVALGYPLHQELTMTSGVASAIREGAIISDVNINPGNSGGPLLTLDGGVVAMNTFGDFNDTGPGVSGSIVIARAGPALDRAALARDSLGPPNDTLLPLIPKAVLRASALRAAAETVDYKEYTRYSEIKVNGRFYIWLQTPLSTFVEMAHFQHELTKDRKKREAQAGVTPDESYSESAEAADWAGYVDDATVPVVSLMVVPDVGVSFGSRLGHAFSAAVGSGAMAKARFKGDVRGVRLLVGTSATPVRPLGGGHGPVPAWEEDGEVQLKDVADLGYYAYDPEAFRPAPDGTPPVMVIVIDDLKHPERSACRILPKEEVARVWNDFEGYYREFRSDRAFNLASRTAKVDPKPVRQLLMGKCEF